MNLEQPWLVRKYISLVSMRLDKFKKKSDSLWNFRCPYCSDSEKSKSKARGYIYLAKSQFRFHCHNCGTSTSFNRFLKNLDQALYLQYTAEFLADSRTPIAPISQTPEPIKYDWSIFNDLKKISSLPVNHFAKKYVMERKIPSNLHYRLFYSENFPKFVNGILPGKLPIRSREPRLVIPSVTKEGTVLGFVGRALEPSTVRYIAISIFGTDLVYGTDTVDFNKDYYVLEGPIDAMFLDNAIAVGSASLYQHVMRLGTSKDRAVLVYDNERRNNEILTLIKYSIDYGWRVVLWPEDVVGKDINEMICNGHSASELMLIMSKNTYQGLEAKLKFSQWKRS